MHVLFNHQLLHEAARLRVRLLYRSRLLLDAAFDFHAIHIKRDVALRAPSNHCIRLLGVGQDNLAILICYVEVIFFLFLHGSVEQGHFLLHTEWFLANTAHVFSWNHPALLVQQ